VDSAALRDWIGDLPIDLHAGHSVQERMRVRHLSGARDVRGWKLLDQWPAYMTIASSTERPESEIVGDEHDGDLRFWRRSSRRSMIWACVVTSSEVVGSSAKITCGSHDNAIAMTIR